MITLCYGSGARDFQVLDDYLPQERWQQLREVTCRLLRAKQQPRAAELLETTPFALKDGTNGFGDDFTVLLWSAPFDGYIRATEQKDNPSDRDAFRQIAAAVSEVCTTYVRFVAVELDTEQGAPSVPPPNNLHVTNDVLEQALRDAENLLSNSGSPSGVDRVHTAFHAYLKAVCVREHISSSSDPSITELFKLIRKQHPSFSQGGVQAHHVDRVLQSLAQIVDALNPLRNQASMAHPVPALLNDAEAMLVINVVRTLLHFLDAKLN